MAAIFVNIDRMEKFQISDPYKVWVSSLPHESPMCSFTLPDILFYCWQVNKTKDYLQH